MIGLAGWLLFLRSLPNVRPFDELFQALATRCLDPGFLNTFRATAHAGKHPNSKEDIHVHTCMQMYALFLKNFATKLVLPCICFCKKLGTKLSISFTTAWWKQQGGTVMDGNPSKAGKHGMVMELCRCQASSGSPLIRLCVVVSIRNVGNPKSRFAWHVFFNCSLSGCSHIPTFPHPPKVFTCLGSARTLYIFFNDFFQFSVWPFCQFFCQLNFSTKRYQTNGRTPAFGITRNPRWPLTFSPFHKHNNSPLVQRTFHLDSYFGLPEASEPWGWHFNVS